MMIQFTYQLGFLTYFNLNQSILTEKYCENKDKPNACCMGKCYLSKKINSEQDESSSKPALQDQNTPLFLLPHNDLFGQIIKSSQRHFMVFQVQYLIGYESLGKKPPKFSLV